MRPFDSTFAAIDDEMEPEPLTVPRPRTISGVVLTGSSSGGAAEPGWSVAEEATGAAWSVAEEATGAGSDPPEEAGIYPIFEDGGAALDWVRRRRAVQQVTAEIEQSPDDPALYLKRAAAKVELGAHREAIEDCMRALSIRPDLADGYLARGEIFFGLEAYAECVADCTKALRIDRTRVEGYQRRANARAALGDYHGAVGDYDEAIMLRPRLAWLFKDRGEMKSRIGDLAGALDDLNVAVAMSPGDEDCLFKRNLVKVTLADHRGGPIDWARATQKALDLLSAKAVAKAEEEEDDRIA
jgi:tetratricopeptide (TPR) repeat protein